MKKLFTLLLICASLTQGYAMNAASTGSKASKEYTDKLVVTINGESRSEERRVGKECRSRLSPYH